MPDQRRDSTSPSKHEKRGETGVQRALANLGDIKRHLRNAEAHISRARREHRTAP
jgi:hypothetical protein